MKIHASASRNSLGRHPTGLLRAQDHVGHVLVHLAHVRPHVSRDLRIDPGLGEGLHPERRAARPFGLRFDERAPDCGEPEPPGRALRRAARPRAALHLLPAPVHTGEIERALRREVAIENRLGHARGASQDRPSWCRGGPDGRTGGRPRRGATRAAPRRAGGWCSCAFERSVLRTFKVLPHRRDGGVSFDERDGRGHLERVLVPRDEAFCSPREFPEHRSRRRR